MTSQGELQEVISRLAGLRSDALGVTDNERCPFCGGELTSVECLQQELVGRVLAEDGEVEIVGHTAKLHSYRGAGALLRQARATGLSGARPGVQ